MDQEPDRPRQQIVQNSEDFRSLLNSSEKSELTIETAGLINSEITSQVSRKLNELMRDLDTQILDSINFAKRISKHHWQSNDRV